MRIRRWRCLLATVATLLFFLVLLGNSLTLHTQFMGVTVYTVDIALLPLIVWVALQKLVAPRTLPFRWTSLDLLLCVFFLLVCVSFVASLDRVHSLMGLLEWVRIVAFYFCARMLCGSVLSERNLMLQFGVLTAFLLGLGFAQIITGEPIGVIGKYFGDSREHYAEWIGSQQRYRVSGPTPNSNVFVIWITLYGTIALSSFLDRGRPARFFALVAAMTTVILTTLSRGGVMGFVVALLFLIALHRTRLQSASFVISSTLAVSLLFVSLLLTYVATSKLPLALSHALVVRTEQARDLSAGGQRRELFSSGVRLLAEPRIFLLGTGHDNMVRAAMGRRGFGSILSTIPPDQLYLTRTGVHHGWLRTAVENGVPAMLVLFILYLEFVRYLLLERRSSDRPDAWNSYALAIAGTYLVVWSQVYLQAVSIAVFLPLSMLMALAAARRTRPEFEREMPAALNSNWDSRRLGYTP